MKYTYVPRRVPSRIRNRRHSITVLRIIFVAVLSGVLFGVYRSVNVNKDAYPELKVLEHKEMTFQEYRQYFRTLAQEKGAVYAFEVLKGAPFVPTVHTHLIGHEIGDVLWEQEGEQGIRNCSEHFRNACSHSIVGILVRNEGVEGIPRIVDVCRNTGGDVHAFEQCIHGIGHGVLASVDYDFENAIRECERGSVGTEGTLALSECVGGVSMELASGGGHNEELYEAQAERFFRDDDPLVPCSALYVSDLARPGCFEYFTTHLFVAAGADRQQPTPEYYERAINLCAAVSAEENRAACYKGFGREFVTLAQSGEVMRIEGAVTATFDRIHAWCHLAKEEKGAASCIGNAAATIFLNGVGAVDDTVLFCSRARSDEARARCWESSIDSARIFLAEEQRHVFCNALPEHERDNCDQSLETR